MTRQLWDEARHAVLYFIEQGLIPKTGKRHEREGSKEAGSPLAETFQDLDWADEVLHARVGRDWYISGLGQEKVPRSRRFARIQIPLPSQ